MLNIARRNVYNLHLLGGGCQTFLRHITSLIAVENMRLRIHHGIALDLIVAGSSLLKERLRSTTIEPGDLDLFTSILVEDEDLYNRSEENQVLASISLVCHQILHRLSWSCSREEDRQVETTYRRNPDRSGYEGSNFAEEIYVTKRANYEHASGRVLNLNVIIRSDLVSTDRHSANIDILLGTFDMDILGVGTFLGSGKCYETTAFKEAKRTSFVTASGEVPEDRRRKYERYLPDYEFSWNLE